jgi:hypothetical protein
MNKIYFVLILICISGSSCKKYLDTKPEDFSSPEQFYETETQLNNALAGVYNTLAADATFGRQMVVELANGTDEAFYKRNALTVNTMLFNYDASNNIVATTWAALYEGVNRANYLLANINKPQMDEKRRDVIRGEALFLRAFFYFHLVSNWGNVPLLLEPTLDGKNVNIPQTPATQVYDQILKDMTIANGLVSTITVTKANGRVTKTAVQGILARVCLKMAGWPLKDVSKYVDARAWADSVIQSGEHTLNPDYKQIFINHSADQYDLKEGIWEVEFLGDNSGAIKLASRFANQFAVRNTNADAGYGYATVGVTPTLYNYYLPYDLRRDWSIATYGYVNNNSLDTLAKTNIYARDSGKWRRGYETVRPLNVNFSNTNFPILRYADVLLMYAEADNEINGSASAQAIEYVNQVRRRGYGKYLKGTTGVSEGLKSITLTNGGTGYTNTVADPIRIIFSGGGGGVDAAAVVTVGADKVITGIQLKNIGAGFSSNPDVSISGGGGTGAQAIASIFPVSVADLKPEHIASKLAFREMIQEERSRELSFEGLRRFDLIRWEKYISAMRQTGVFMELNAPADIQLFQGIPAYFWVQEKHRLLPIPSADITLNKALEQNPGW